VNWKPNIFWGGDNKWEFSGTVGLGDRWAMNYRQINFKPKFNGNPIDSSNKEVNVIYKMNDTIQLMAGYSMTKRHGTFSTHSLPKDNMVQGGVIASKSLGPSTTLYTLLSLGSKGNNIEVGLSYQIEKDLELTTTYRHLEYNSGRGQEDFRGFGIGLTFKN
jgi:predicted porin